MSLSDPEALDYARRLKVLRGTPRDTDSQAEIGIMFAELCQTTKDADTLLMALLASGQWPGIAAMKQLASRLFAPVEVKPRYLCPIPEEWEAAIAKLSPGFTSAELTAACDRADRQTLKRIDELPGRDSLYAEAERILDTYAQANPQTQAHIEPFRAENIRLGVLALYRRRQT